MSPQPLEENLRSAAGIRAIVATRQSETDPLEFTREINRREPGWELRLRKECAALASVGVGYLVVGIDESRDGFDRAAKIVGVTDAPDLIKAIKDRLGSGLSPPITKREVWEVDLGDEGVVVVVKVQGRRGYPIEVEDAASPPRHWVREGGRPVALRPEAARVRRISLDNRIARLLIVGSAPVLALVAVGVSYTVQKYREYQQAEWVLDPDLCPVEARFAGSAVTAEFGLRDLNNRAQTAIVTGDSAACEQVHRDLVARFPTYGGRHYLEGQCLLLSSSVAARDRFEASVHLAEEGLRQRPGRLCFQILKGLSEVFAGRETKGCETLLAAAAQRTDWDTKGTSNLDRAIPPGRPFTLKCPAVFPMLMAVGATRR